MSNSSLQVAQDMTYSPPIQHIKGLGVYTAHLPITAQQAVSSGNRIQFAIRNSQDYVDLHRSYIRITLNNTAALTFNGVNDIFDQVQERLGGTSFETFYNYGVLANQKNIISTKTRKSLIAVTEGWTGSAVTLAAASTTKYACPIPTNMVGLTKLLPLALCGTWDLTLVLANLSASYTVSAELMLFTVTPDAEYLSQTFDHIQQGGEVALGNTFVKSYINNILDVANTTQFQLNVGYVESMTSIFQYLSSATGVITQVNYLCDSKQYPTNTYIYGDTWRADMLMMMVSAFNSADADLDATALSNSSYLSLSNGTGEVKSGLRLESGVVQTNLTYRLTTAADRIFTFIECQGVIAIGSNGAVTLRYR